MKTKERQGVGAIDASETQVGREPDPFIAVFAPATLLLRLLLILLLSFPGQQGGPLHEVLRGWLDTAYGFKTQHEQLRVVVTNVYTREWDERRPAAAGEDGEELALACALREMDGLFVALFVTMDVLDLIPWGETVFTAALEECDRKMDKN